MSVYHGMNAVVGWSHVNVVTALIDISGRGNDTSLTIDMPLADITGFGSVAKSFVAGQYGWKATFRGWYDSQLGTAGNIDGILGSCVLSTTAGSLSLSLEGSAAPKWFYNGAAFLTSYAATSNLGGGVSVTASFTGTGVVRRTACT